MEWVRVKQKSTGHVLTVAKPFNEARYVELDGRAAVGIGGAPLPPKFFVDKGPKVKAVAVENVEEKEVL